LRVEVGVPVAVGLGVPVAVGDGVAVGVAVGVGVVVAVSGAGGGGVGGGGGLAVSGGVGGGLAVGGGGCGAVGGGGGSTLDSKAPISQLPVVPSSGLGRGKPRWSVVSRFGGDARSVHEAKGIASVAGLPACSAMVWVGPPLSFSPALSSFGSVLF